MSTPTERILSALEARDCGPRQAGKGWSARCPAHEDRRASLSIAEGDDGRALVHCHAGCAPDAICAAVGLRVVDLMPTADKLPTPTTGNGRPKGNGKPRIVAEYDYRDEAGNVVFQVVRMEPKGFRQRKPKPGGGWDWSVTGVRVVPYRLQELLAEPTRPVVVAEGEKDCDNLARIGVLATCNAGGAGKWMAEHAEYLRGRWVCIVPDNDDPGRKHAQQVAQSLQGIAASVRIVELPGLPPKGDVSDWIAAGGTKADLKRLAEAATVWTPTVAAAWPEIVPFAAADLPEFPTHVLPNVLRQWVEAESHATQTPADLAAMLALSVCASCIARRVVVEPRPGWREPVNLYAAVLLEPGNRKSAVFADATKPLIELEAGLIEEARPIVARAQSERRQKELRLRKLEKLAADKGGAAIADAGDLAEELACEPELVLPRLIVADATAEKLGMMLADQGGRIASMSPEGGVFDLMAGLYSKSGIPQFEVYLKSHAGDDLITDRVSRPSVRVERPALTCAYAMQPAVMAGIADQTAFRGRGLLARFLYAAPRSWIGERQIAPAPMTDGTRADYRRIVRSLTEIQGETVQHLSPDAADLFRRWEAEIETTLADGGKLESLRDWGAKLAGATLRLAAVLHNVEFAPGGEIDAPTITAAVEIARYLIPHAAAAMRLMLAHTDTADADARYVLRWIERHEKKTFTKSEAQHHGKRRFPLAEDIDPVLCELVRRGYVRLMPVESAGPGRPPSPVYATNPSAFDFSGAKKRSYNSHNSSGDPENGNCGNIGSAFQQSENENRVRVTI